MAGVIECDHEFVDGFSCIKCGWMPLRCGRCYDEVDAVFPANCAEKPERLLGAPLGMYHCPDCGAMVIAGVSHWPLCQRCLDRTHPAFDDVEG